MWLSLAIILSQNLPNIMNIRLNQRFMKKGNLSNPETRHSININSNINKMSILIKLIEILILLI